MKESYQKSFVEIACAFDGKRELSMKSPTGESTEKPSKCPDVNETAGLWKIGDFQKKLGLF